jgi:uncharacterized lipoprotein
MKALFLFCVLAGVGMLAGCSWPGESRQPMVYRGGQDYENAIHAEDVKGR